MGEDIWVEKLAWFKQNEKPEVVLVMADTLELIKIVVAWTSLEVKRAEKLTELKSKTENEVWEWLWENAKFSLVELKEKIGISFSELALENKLKPLVGNRVTNGLIIEWSYGVGKNNIKRGNLAIKNISIPAKAGIQARRLIIWIPTPVSSTGQASSVWLASKLMKLVDITLL